MKTTLPGLMAEDKKVSVVNFLGSFAVEVFRYLHDLFLLTTAAASGMFVRKRRRGIVLKYIEEIGLGSLPLAGIISTFTGMVLVMETVSELKKFGAAMYTASIVSVSMVRELGPVLVGLIVAGRVGAAIAAELGTMKITEQIDALKVLAVDPVNFLVSPRFLGGLVALPILFLIAFFLAIGGGFLVGVHLVGIGPGMYLSQTFRFVTLKDLAVGLLKIVAFTTIIINVACLEGFRARGGAEGVGRASTSAVVSSFFLIILANLVITAIFYFF